MKNTVLRLLTAFVLIPLVIWLVCMAPNWPKTFMVCTGGLVLWAGIEWTALLGIQSAWLKTAYVGLILCLLLMVSWYMPVSPLLYAGTIWWLLAGVLVAAWPRLGFLWSRSSLLKALMGICCLVPAYLAVNFLLFTAGRLNLLYLFLLVWSADSGAWLAGKCWGRRLLAPGISPGKTLEGVLGGMGLAISITVAALWYGRMPVSLWGAGLVLCFVTVLFSVLGDLFESLLKRQAGLKDSGRLLPGHGGLLDRIDGLLAAAPVHVTGLLLLNHVVR